MLTGIDTFQEPPTGQKSVGKDVARKAKIAVYKAAHDPSEARELMMMLGLLPDAVRPVLQRRVRVLA